MSRILAVGAIAVIIASAVGLYQVKYQVQDMERTLAGLKRDIVRDRAAIQVLEAEWSYLNQPDRLQDLADRYLELAPVTPSQMAAIESLPPRAVTPPAQPAVADAKAGAKTPAKAAANSAAPSAKVAAKPASPSPTAKPAAKPVAGQAKAVVPKPAPPSAPSGGLRAAAAPNPAPVSAPAAQAPVLVSTSPPSPGVALEGGVE
jgi:hypothetical protein